jgi:mannose-1-phosphate guanylyltransferase
MAGGSGTRFWPKSTAKCPKQLLSFGVDGGDTLLKQTLKRFEGFVPSAQRFVLTTSALEPAVQEQALGAQILAEPQGRNTAPCIYWAARVIADLDPEAVMLVMPSDHYMADLPSFSRTLEEACQWAASHDDLVTLGVRPNRPETGYGYLKMGMRMEKDSPCQRVDAFVEKPNLERAKNFVAQGNYLWNGGMFLWRAEVILRAFDEFMPEMKAAWEASGGDILKAYPLMPATSIDYGVMERGKNVVSFPLDCGWDDLGSWTSLESVADTLKARHAAGVVMGGEVLSFDSSGNIVDTPHRLTALLGVKDLIVVEHNGAILIADKNRAQEIRLIVEELKKRRPDLL